VRIETIGDFDSLPPHTKEAINHAKEKTKNNDGLLLNFALNYGGRYDIIQGMKAMMSEVEEGRLHIDDIDEKMFSNYLFTGISQGIKAIMSEEEKGRIHIDDIDEKMFSNYLFT